MHPDSQTATIQAAHRRRLVEAWAIPPGASILEIGCGQGDMTIALAEAVGPTGRVVAVDIADRNYGAPLTLGQATDLVMGSPLGERIEFIFEFDVLHPTREFQAFDYVVLAHSSWYFASPNLLEKTLSAVRPWARALCFAEWDLTPQSVDQLPHLLAVLIQGQIEAFKTDSVSNVKSPLARKQIQALVEKAGWTIASQSIIDSRAMQDADWEIAACVASIQEATGPDRFHANLETQLQVLQSLALPRGNASLSTFTLLAQQ